MTGTTTAVTAAILSVIVDIVIINIVIVRVLFGCVLSTVIVMTRTGYQASRVLNMPLFGSEYGVTRFDNPFW